MILDCIIIDDDNTSIITLKRLISNNKILKLTAVYKDANTALNQLLNGAVKADITFLDIELPDIKGIEVAQKIHDITTVIFVTGHPAYAVASYELGIIEFLVKPVLVQRFNQAIERVAEYIARVRSAISLGEYLTLSTAKATVRILYDEIKYIESNSNYICIFTANGAKKFHRSLENIVSMLPSEIFMRVHRSYMINLRRFYSYEDGTIVLQDKSEIPLGRTYKRQFLDYINK